MSKYVIKRILTIIPVLVGVTIVTFLLARTAPGNPAYSVYGPEATEEIVQNVNEKWGLDKPIYQQYGIWLGNMIHGDFGTSIIFNKPVLQLLNERLQVTFELMIISMFFALFVGIPTGIISAVKRNTSWDYFSRIFSLSFISIPRFWLAIVLLLGFTYYLPIFPTGGWTPWSAGLIAHLKCLVLPGLSLGLYFSAYISRMMRSGMLDVINKNYITVARSFGVSETEVVLRDAGKNALISTVTILAFLVGWALSSTVMVETVFNLPGIGRAIVKSIFSRDYPVIQATVLWVALVFTISNLLVDLLYAFLDPRIRY